MHSITLLRALAHITKAWESSTLYVDVKASVLSAAILEARDLTTPQLPSEMMAAGADFWLI